MDDCEICPILATRSNGKDVQVIETKRWRVVLDPNQRFLAKAFITLLEHKTSLSELSEADWRDFESLVKRLELAIKKAFHAHHFNWSCLMNVAAMNGQQTHVHWHLHPRYDKSITIGAHTFEDTPWYPRKENTNHVIEKEVLQIVADKIRENL